MVKHLCAEVLMLSVLKASMLGEESIGQILSL